LGTGHLVGPLRQSIDTSPVAEEWGPRTKQQEPSRGSERTKPTEQKQKKRPTSDEVSK